MRIVVQRVSDASVSVSGKNVGKIGKGYFVLLGIHCDDGQKDLDFVVQKLNNLRVMADSKNKMNLNLLDSGGSILLVSQFTLYADTKKGNRPSFVKAADTKKAEKLYNCFIRSLKSRGIPVSAGIFGADMKIGLSLDGPVTIIIDSKEK